MSIDELRCRFLDITLGDSEDAAAVAGGEGLMGGESNGSGGGPFFGGFKLVISRGGMDF